VEKELTGRETEPWEVYFKLYKSQMPVVEQATAALMLGTGSVAASKICTDIPVKSSHRFCTVYGRLGELALDNFSGRSQRHRGNKQNL